MNDITIILIGIATIVIGLLWYRGIQKSRENDKDFDRRDEAKEVLEEQDSIL